MRRNILRTRAAVTAVLLVGAVLLLGPGTSFAAPTLGADCGAGASVEGTDSAGRVTLGTGVTENVCTLTFSSTWTNVPVCMAMNETAAGSRRAGHPGPVGAKPTTTTVVLDGTASGAAPIVSGDVVSYLCVSY